jgi:hypothetical protein
MGLHSTLYTYEENKVGVYAEYINKEEEKSQNYCQWEPSDIVIIHARIWNIKARIVKTIQAEEIYLIHI